jgi:hypothetical protein
MHSNDMEMKEIKLKKVHLDGNGSALPLVEPITKETITKFDNPIEVTSCKNSNSIADTSAISKN